MAVLNTGKIYLGDTLLSGGVQPLYSFGLLADLHIQYATGLDNPLTSDATDDGDFRRALLYLRDRVPFTCVVGDLLSYATEEFYQQYKNCVDTNKGNMDIYECGGNHETYPSQGVSGTLDETLWKTYTGKDPYYSFEYQEDVFIFISAKNVVRTELFPDGALDWLESTLETNKNKRCFVFMHFPAYGDKTADYHALYDNRMTGMAGASFVGLLSHYKNAIHVHGHTHLTLLDENPPIANEFAIGFRSIHVPSMVSPRFYDRESNTLRDYYYDENGTQIWGSYHSEGYIVDVYENKVVLRGIDFASGTNRDEVVEMNEVYTLDTPMYFIPTVTGIEATFTQGENIIYTDNTLNDLKTMLVVKTVDELGKVIVTDYSLSGTLEVGTCPITVTYESFNGTHTTTFNVMVTEEVVITDGYNKLKYSQNLDGTQFYGDNGEQGYKVDYSLSNSTGNESASSGMDVTGYIPVSVGDVIRFNGFTFNSDNTNCKVQFYKHSNYGGGSLAYGRCNTGTYTDDWGAVWEGTSLKQITITSNASSGKNVDLTQLGYIRVVGADMTENSIITVNEEIPS